MCLLMTDKSERLSGIWNDFNNNTLLGIDNYPNIPTAAYDVLFRYKKRTPPRQTHAPPGAVTFFQHDNIGKNMVSGDYGLSFAVVMLYRCHKMGYCLSSTSITSVGS